MATADGSRNRPMAIALRAVQGVSVGDPIGGAATVAAVAVDAGARRQAIGRGDDVGPACGRGRAERRGVSAVHDDPPGRRAERQADRVIVAHIDGCWPRNLDSLRCDPGHALPICSMVPDPCEHSQRHERPGARGSSSAVPSPPRSWLASPASPARPRAPPTTTTRHRPRPTSSWRGRPAPPPAPRRRRRRPAARSSATNAAIGTVTVRSDNPEFVGAVTSRSGAVAGAARDRRIGTAPGAAPVRQRRRSSASVRRLRRRQPRPRSPRAPTRSPTSSGT